MYMQVELGQMTETGPGEWEQGQHPKKKPQF